MPRLFCSLITAAIFVASSTASAYLSLVDYGSGEAVVQITVTEAGTSDVFIAGESTGISISSVELASGSPYTTPIAGDNPFLVGDPASPTSGLWFDLDNNHFFASFGAAEVSPGTYDFLALDYDLGNPNGCVSGDLNVEGRIVANGAGGDLLYNNSLSIGGSPLPGDANCDGQVDPADAAILGGNWLMPVSGGLADADFNGDGFVDPADAAILGGEWLSGTAATTTAPEPASLGLLLSTAATAGRRRSW